MNTDDPARGDDAVHAIVTSADDARIDPDYLYPGEAFALEFDTPGVYAYYCTTHPGMDGSITVN